MLEKYPEVYLGKMHGKIEATFDFRNRTIYKTEGNRPIILSMLREKNLTVNQIAGMINMTRQGVRAHVHILEREGKLIRSGTIGERNIVYSYRG